MHVKALAQDWCHAIAETPGHGCVPRHRCTTEDEARDAHQGPGYDRSRTGGSGAADKADGGSPNSGQEDPEDDRIR